MSINKKVAFYTLGCKVNQYETDTIKNQLLKKNFEEVKFDDIADIYIINSCTVTGVADRKTRNILKRAKKINPDGIIILTGCYAQTNYKELSQIKEIDYIIGNSYKNKLADFIDNLNIKNSEIKNHKILNENIFLLNQYEEYDFAAMREMSRAYIKIQDGCNNFCSYCKIPFARGKSRSRSQENIISEIENIINKGFKEIILIGINLGDYGADLKPATNIENLLTKILKIKNLQRIRIGSVYPDKISDSFIELLKNEKLMPHLHISLQSCDDYILQQMHRKYNAKLILDRLLKLKNTIKNIELTGDIIVGFPGETEEMFENSYKLIKKISFSNLHIFQYSDRENTIASNIFPKVKESIKKERMIKLQQLKDKMRATQLSKYINKELNVLVEEEKKDFAYGYSENYLRVKGKFLGKIGEIVKVKIKKIEKEILISYE